MTRKLASIQQILDVQPIFNADAIEVVTINGWKVVAKKSEFKVNDLCVFYEIDSFLPVRPEYEFLRKSCYRKMGDGSEGFRLKTIKLRGQLSQGLALPLNVFNLENVEEGLDVTELLGVKKYEQYSPVVTSGRVRNFPGFIRKTDQERIQNIWHKFKHKYNDVNFEVTLKLDGSSATYYHRDGKVGVCSRNMELKEDGDGSRCTTWHRVADEIQLLDKLKEYGENIAIQGEIIGESIQGNKEKILGQKLFIFDIFDINRGVYLSPSERIDTLIILGLIDHHIPIFKSKKLSEFETIDHILAFAEGESLRAKVREGVVFRSLDYIDGEILSFKAISNQFLLGEE